MVNRILLSGFYPSLPGLRRSRVPRNVSRRLGGTETSTHRSARQATFLYVPQPSITTPFRTFTPSQALVMHLSQPLEYSLLSLRHPEQMATPSSHEWNVSKTSQAQTCTLKVFLCKSTNLYVFMITRYVLVIIHFLLANLDSGCLGGPIHDQK
jgi:hypothetical protein